ncbi:hypothetical protein [uncultured Desulfosarcina sp.]|uniref:hypothetical protein n=1 Tax=uncultured Desulfosarcina sp. TaxID=218289 RepID=UPI0029C98794|nr:hypothetical protein [uncultured Desulfosarcina sp.]
MDEFATICRQVDARFDRVMGNLDNDEPAPVMLIRAAARMTMTSYPDHRLKDRVLDALLESATHLKAMEEDHD